MRQTKDIAAARERAYLTPEERAAQMDPPGIEPGGPVELFAAPEQRGSGTNYTVESEGSRRR